MSSSVRFRFKSAREFETLPFEGDFVKVADLKVAIVERKKLNCGEGFDLEISDASTLKVFEDESELVHKNSALIVRRIPAPPNGKSILAEQAMAAKNERYAEKTAETNEPGAIPAEQQPILDVTTTIEGADEDDRIASLIMQSNAQLDQFPVPVRGHRHRGGHRGGGRHHHYNNNRNTWNGGNRHGGGGNYVDRAAQPSSNYICHRCNEPGHWIDQCPTNGDPTYDKIKVRAPTGIPRSMLRQVDAPESGTGLKDSSGHFVTLQPNEEEFARQTVGLRLSQAVAAGTRVVPNAAGSSEGDHPGATNGNDANESTAQPDNKLAEPEGAASSAVEKPPDETTSADRAAGDNKNTSSVLNETNSSVVNGNANDATTTAPVGDEQAQHAVPKPLEVQTLTASARPLRGGRGGNMSRHHNHNAKPHPRRGPHAHSGMMPPHGMPIPPNMPPAFPHMGVPFRHVPPPPHFLMAMMANMNPNARNGMPPPNMMPNFVPFPPPVTVDNTTTGDAKSAPEGDIREASVNRSADAHADETRPVDSGNNSRKEERQQGRDEDYNGSSDKERSESRGRGDERSERNERDSVNGKSRYDERSPDRATREIVDDAGIAGENSNTRRRNEKRDIRHDEEVRDDDVMIAKTLSPRDNDHDRERIHERGRSGRDGRPRDLDNADGGRGVRSWEERDRDRDHDRDRERERVHDRERERDQGRERERGRDNGGGRTRHERDSRYPVGRRLSPLAPPSRWRAERFGNPDAKNGAGGQGERRPWSDWKEDRGGRRDDGMRGANGRGRGDERWSPEGSARARSPSPVRRTRHRSPSPSNNWSRSRSPTRRRRDASPRGNGGLDRWGRGRNRSRSPSPRPSRAYGRSRSRSASRRRSPVPRWRNASPGRDEGRRKGDGGAGRRGRRVWNGRDERGERGVGGNGGMKRERDGGRSPDGDRNGKRFRGDRSPDGVFGRGGNGDGRMRKDDRRDRPSVHDRLGRPARDRGGGASQRRSVHDRLG